MIQRTTWILLLLVVLVGAYVWFFERRIETTDQRRVRQTFVWPILPDQVKFLAIESEDFYVECEKRREGWFLTAPVHARADGERIHQILNVLEDMPRVETLTAQDRKRNHLALDAFQLDNPRVRIVAEYAGRREEFRIGGNTSVGDHLYVRVASQEEVCVTSTNILAVLPQTVEEMREHRFLYRDPLLAARLEIHHPEGFIQLARRDGAWMIEQPVIARADQAKVETILSSLGQLTIESFIADFRADPVVYRLGVDDAVAQVALWWKDGEEFGLRLFFGKEVEEAGDRIYARRGDMDSICTVRRDILNILPQKAGALREHVILSSSPDDIYAVEMRQGETRLLMERSVSNAVWRISEPVQALADDRVVTRLLAHLAGMKVDAFIEPHTTNLTLYGLDIPACELDLRGPPVPGTTGMVTHVSLSGVGGGVTPEPMTATAGATPPAWQIQLRIGRPVPGATNLYAMLAGDRMILALPRDVLNVRLDPNADPMPLPFSAVWYRDRTVLQLAPQAIRRITRIDEAGTSVTIEKSQDNHKVWTATSLRGGTVQEEVVEDILKSVSRLRAVRLVSDKPGMDALYGLDKPALRMTFGLTGETAIQKTLIFGRRTSEGCYAMLQGQDVVFILDHGVCRQLFHEIVEQEE